MCWHHISMAQRLFPTCYDLETGHEIHNSTKFDRLFAKVCWYCKGLLDTHAVVYLQFRPVKWASKRGKEHLRDFLVSFGIAKATKHLTPWFVNVLFAIKYQVWLAACFATTHKKRGSLFFSNCRFDDVSRLLFGWFQKVRQADAESIVSAAYGNHKALRYQDFLKFFLPEASWDILLMPSVKALSWKALVRFLSFWCRWPMIWKIRSHWPSTWKIQTFVWFELSAPPCTADCIFPIIIIELTDWHLHMLSVLSDQCFNLHGHRNHWEFRSKFICRAVIQPSPC